MVVRENQARRDLTKVAQYEVLGNDAEREVRPARDDRKGSPFCLACGLAIVSIRRSSRPGRIGLLDANPALRTGLLSSGPCGTSPHRIILIP
jgi:hypothetical protein